MYWWVSIFVVGRLSFWWLWLLFVSFLLIIDLMLLFRVETTVARKTEKKRADDKLQQRPHGT